MPSVNGIEYADTEDLNKYFYDNFSTTERIEETTTQTGDVETAIFEQTLSTGVTASSICMTNYDYNYFNPTYGEAVWKLRVNSMDNAKVFFGFKETTAAPIFPSEGQMTESHLGFMLDWENGACHLYASCSDGTTQRKVEIVGIDMTRVENYKISANKFSIMPLPYVEEELGLPHVYSIDRKWREVVDLSAYPAENKVHWIVQYIKNLTGEEKYLKINRFIYKEVYAD